jgi:hypothetical protein
MSLDCNIIEVFHNISNTCSNDISFARDECKLFCMISVMNGIEMCSKELFNVGLLDQLKELIKWCIYKKYEIIISH